MEPWKALEEYQKHREGHAPSDEARDGHPFLESAKAKASGIYPLLFCAVPIGLRRGELIGLQWGDIDLSGRYPLVRRAVVRGIEGLPKQQGSAS